MANDLTPAAPPKPVVELTQQAVEQLGIAEAYEIDSREMYEIGSDALREIRRLEDATEAQRTAITKPLNESLRQVNGMFKPITEKLDQAKRMLTRKMIGFEDAERARVAALEAAALAEREKRMAESNQRLAEVEAKVEAGEATTMDLVEAQVEATVATIAPVGHTEAPVSRGGHARVDDWGIEITDMPALLRFVADAIERGDDGFAAAIPQDAVRITPFKAVAKASGGKRQIPGIRFIHKPRIAARK